MQLLANMETHNPIRELSAKGGILTVEALVATLATTLVSAAAPVEAHNPTVFPAKSIS
jgi:hypothetical protein